MLEPVEVDPPKATSVFGIAEANSVLVSTVGTMVFDVMGRAPRVSAEVLNPPGKAVLVSGVVGTNPPGGEIGVKPVLTLGASSLCKVLNSPGAEAISRPLPLRGVVAKFDPLKAEPRIGGPP